jgi:hypothetical protein
MGTAVVAFTVAVVAAVAIGAGANLWIFEVLAAVGALVGVGLAFGLLDRSPFASRRGRMRTAVPSAPPELSAQVTAQLAALDPVEHRSLALGAPWPTVVVGPTGVRVVTVAGTPDAAVLHALDGVVAQVREVAFPDLDVTGVLVVPTPARWTRHGAVQVIGHDQLADVLARGPLVPMPVVVRVFARVSARLAPDLRDPAATRPA